MKILMIGCGNMGGAMATKWRALADLEVTVIDPLATPPPGVELYRSRSELGDQEFDVLVIAIKPQLVIEVAPDYADVIADGGFVLSIAAGFRIEALSSIFLEVPTIRIMPNLPALIGRSVTGLFAADEATKAHRDQAHRLASAIGAAIWLEDEDGIDRLTAVAGSGPGYVFEFLRNYVDATVALGFSYEQARDIVFETVRGTTQMAAESSKSLAALRDSVTSKNGTTEAGLNILRRDDVMQERMNETIAAAYARAIELRSL